MQTIDSRGFYVNTHADMAIDKLVRTLRETHSVKFLFKLGYEQYSLLPREIVNFDLDCVITTTVLPIEWNDYSNKWRGATLIFMPLLRGNIFIRVKIWRRGLVHEYNRIKVFLTEYLSNLNVPDDDINQFWSLHDRPSVLLTNSRSNSSYRQTIENEKIFYPMSFATTIANVYKEINTTLPFIKIDQYIYSAAFGLTTEQLLNLSSEKTSLPNKFVQTKIDMPAFAINYPPPTISAGAKFSTSSELIEYIFVYAWLFLKKKGGLQQKEFCQMFGKKRSTFQDCVTKYSKYF